MGSEVAPQEVSERFDGLKTNENVKGCFKRFQSRLSDIKVDLKKTKVRLGTTLAMDVKKETFTDSEKANNMLTRDYRKPFVVPKTADL